MSKFRTWRAGRAHLSLRYRSFLTRLRNAAVVAALALSTSGCFLQLLTGTAFDGGESLIVTAETDSILSTCTNSSFSVGCSYFIRDENGVPVDFTSTADLISEFGFLGLIIDPLLYQIPETAFNITGTYDDGGANSGALVIRSGYKSIPIDTYRTLFAEHRQQFVIAELPDGVPFDGIEYSFDLSFELPLGSPTPVQVKPILSIKFTGAGREFYTPFLPCVDDMADAPALDIGLSATPQPIALPGPPQVCNGEQYLLLGFGVFPCDFDADDDVDADDIALQASVRNARALPGDRLDANGDGWIDLNDARICAQQCLQPRCAVTPPPDTGVLLPHQGVRR